jgi:glutamate/tyrosine decarboxylase-like PLP-dependent enzyme
MVEEINAAGREPGDLLQHTAELAAAYLEGLPERLVRPEAAVGDLRAALALPLQDTPMSPDVVLDQLVTAAEPGVVGTASPRYFGFVIGGALPAALAADWMASTWDQNAGLYVCGPSASVVEEAAGTWLKDLLGLPADASFALTTGCLMAHFTALAAARHHLLSAAGWDPETRGLMGAPPIRVLASVDRHVTVDRALRFLGLGTDCIEPLPVDDGGRMDLDALTASLQAPAGPTIVCAQVGEVNTGAIDPVAEICALARPSGAWVHVDGAFGLWAAASPRLRHLVDGMEGADSWATDCHKWLNVPYDSGLAICAYPQSHLAAMSVHASYLEHGDADGPRDELDWTPEFSRRARGFSVYAALRSLGRQGVADLIDRCCAHARLFADLLREDSAVEVLNDVVLNQVLVRFRAPDGDDDGHTREVIRRVQDDGTCWMSGTTWRGRAAMRISVCNWRTTSQDIQRSAAAVLRAAGRTEMAASLNTDGVGA